MAKYKFSHQTRVIKVTHPQFPDIVLFEAVVRIANINKTFIEKIEGIDIKYSMKHLTEDIKKGQN